MNHFIKFFLKGLLVLAPLSISIYCMVWLFIFIERLAQQGLSKMFGLDVQFPGLGILFTVLLVTGIGILMHTIVAQRLYNLLQSLIARLPVLKTIYFAIDDFMGFFTTSGDKDSSAKKVVLVKLAGEVIVVGILTNEHPEQVINISMEDKVAVYLPMSYQIGGYTVFVKKDQIEETDLSVEDGMKLSMTGWIKKATESN